jgi:hypothetical protein
VQTYIPIATAVLVLLTVAVILLRVFWLRIPAKLRYLLLRAAIAILLLQILSTVTKWTTTSDHLNALFYAAAVASYELLLLLFARLRPRWLTSLSSVVLLIPVFSFSILFPLTSLFNPPPPPPISLGDHLFYEKLPWDTGDPATDGADFFIFYKPPFAPFLRHKIKRPTLSNVQCNVAAASIAFEPDRKSLRIDCPPWPDRPLIDTRSLHIPVR